ASNFLKLAWNMPTNLRAWASYAALSAQVSRGLRILASTPGTESGTRNLKCGSIRISTWARLPSKAALSKARVALIGMREPVPNWPPVQPVLTSQQSAWCWAIRLRSRLPYSEGWRGMKGAPKQVEKVGCGSLPRPFSVPATLAVKPDRKWYIACDGVSLEIGGSTPNASAVSMMTFFGWPARPVSLALGMKSIG